MGEELRYDADVRSLRALSGTYALQGSYVDPATQGAVSDARRITDGVMTVGQPTLSSPSVTFTAADVGKLVNVIGAGPATGLAQGVLSTTIQSVSGGVATLVFSAVSSVSGATVTWGTDNTAAIQTAIDSGSVVLLRQGTNYMVKSLHPRSNVTILGYGATLWHDSTTTNTAVIDNGPSPGSALTNFQVLGLAFVGAGLVAGWTNQVLSRVAINLYGATNVTVRDCKFSYFASAAVQVKGVADKIWITDNYITQCCVAGSHNAINIESHSGDTACPTNVQIRGNYVDNCLTSAICLSVTNATGPVNIVIADNDVTSSYFAAIALETTGPGSGIQRVSIHNNTCRQTAANGSGTYGIAVSDNATAGSRSPSAAQFSNISVTDNTVVSSDGGVTVQASYSNISDNTIEAVSSGLTWTGNGQNLPVMSVIAGNVVHMAADGGSGMVVAASNATVANNQITHDTGSSTSNGHGMLVQGSFLHITGNHVSYSPAHGIYLNGCSEVGVIGNYVRNPSEGGTDVSSGIVALNMAVVTGPNVISGNRIIDDRAVSKMHHAARNNGGSSGLIVLTNNFAKGYTQGSWMAGFTSSSTLIRGNWINDPNTLAVASITPGASPYTYTHADQYPEDVAVSGGTVTSIVFQRSATTVATGQTSGLFRLESGDKLIVTYSVAPTMQKIPRAT